MTQNTFAPPALEAPDVDEPAGGSRRTVLVAGGAVVAVLLAGGGYLLLSGGTSTTPSAAPAAGLGSNAAVIPVVARKPSVTAVPPAAQVPPTSTVPLGRDPFHPLYIVPVAAPVTATTTTAPVTPTASTGSTGTSTTSGSAAPPPAAPAVYKLVLTGVSGSGSSLTAAFNVAGKVMVAKAGSVFGPTSELKLLSVTQSAKGVWTATIQVGDSEPIDAPQGQALYVR